MHGWGNWSCHHNGRKFLLFRFWLGWKSWTRHGTFREDVICSEIYENFNFLNGRNSLLLPSLLCFENIYWQFFLPLCENLITENNSKVFSLANGGGGESSTMKANFRALKINNSLASRFLSFQRQQIVSFPARGMARGFNRESNNQ